MKRRSRMHIREIFSREAPPPSVVDITHHALDESQSEMMDRRFRETYGAVRAYQGDYIDAKMLQKFKIISKSIELDTGNTEDGGAAYITPLPPQKIAKLLDITNPWELYSKSKSHQKEKHPKLGQSPLVEAKGVWSVVRGFLKYNQNGIEGIMPMYSNWAAVEYPDYSVLYRRAYGEMGPLIWCLCITFRQFIDKDADILDNDRPHSMAFVCDKNPLVDKELLHSELSCVLYLAFEDWLDKDYSEHRFFPSTIISGSDRQVRIVQCVLDSETGNVEVRKSPILDFGDGILAEKNKNEFMTLLGWVMGMPAGQTKREDAKEAEGVSAQHVEEA